MRTKERAPALPSTCTLCGAVAPKLTYDELPFCSRQCVVGYRSACDGNGIDTPDDD